MKKLFFFLFVLLQINYALGQEKKPVKVLLLGVFHFHNPGLDVAKFKDADILSAARQKEVLEIVEALKKFAPSKIFVESVPSQQLKIDSAVAAYKAGKLQLKADETQQLGYRLANDLNLQTLYAVDYKDSEFPFDSLMKSAVQANQMQFVSFVQKTIDTIQKSFNEALEKSTIKEMILRENTEESIRMQVEFYYKLLPVGKAGNHVGSYLVGEWWRRNMVIYENILKSLTGKEERILVIFGAGHTALLHEMMKYNRDIELINPAFILK